MQTKDAGFLDTARSTLTKGIGSLRGAAPAAAASAGGGISSKLQAMRPSFGEMHAPPGILAKTAPVKRAVNPTLMGVEATNDAYKDLHPEIQRLIETHPLVAQHGMTPQAAHQIMGWSVPKGQGLTPANVHQTMYGKPLPPAAPMPNTIPSPRMHVLSKAASDPLEVMKAAFLEELDKIASDLQKRAGVAGRIGDALGHTSGLGKHLLKYEHQYDLGGLGILAAPAMDTLQHQIRKGPGNRDKREMAHAGLELGGLGTLAAPVAMMAMKGAH